MTSVMVLKERVQSSQGTLKPITPGSKFAYLYFALPILAYKYCV